MGSRENKIVDLRSVIRTCVGAHASQASLMPGTRVGLISICYISDSHAFPSIYISLLVRMPSFDEILVQE